MRIFLLCFLMFCANCEKISNEESQASEAVARINEQQIEESYKVSLAKWAFTSNITKENSLKQKEAIGKHAEFSVNIAMELLKYNFHSFKNQTLKRLIKKITNIGDDLLDVGEFNDLKDAIANMQENYAKVKIENYRNKNEFVSLEPELTEIFVNSRDPEELKYYWANWYNLAGTRSRENFFEYVELRNKAAKLSNFTSGAEIWLDRYEDSTIEKQVEDILKQLEPLYLQLHGYVRHKLHEFYGPKIVNTQKPIPMHLLGNLWGQQWDTIADLVLPYQSESNMDVSSEMHRQHYTPKKMFEMGNEFFVSLNMTTLPDSFWKNSIIEKPKDGRDLICHASAWDFSIDSDVRIKQCTRVSMEHFITIHHELGHVQYYLQYHHLPVAFREGANPGFHEAIGDVLALSASTPKHLERIGLLKDFNFGKKSQINQFIRTALAKLVFLPFAYAMDKLRWDVFRGNIKPELANCHFWRLREHYGGVEPAVRRTNRDFDITAKYHASADVEYLRYFVSFVIQFQFHKAACIKAGEYEPNNPDKTLNNCDIYQSAEAGNAMKAMLKMGSSKPWPDAMEVLTGTRKLDAGALLEYFKPLEEWLLKTNKELGVRIGWEKSDKIGC